MKSKKIKRKPKNVTVVISVHNPGGTLYEKDALVRLGRTKLKKTKGQNFYRAEIPKGKYKLSVTAGDMLAPSRILEVTGRNEIIPVYLGKKGWPSYRMGQNRVPFQPEEKLVGLIFETKPPSEKKSKDLIKKVSKQFKLQPLKLKNEKGTNIAGDGAIWMFKLKTAKDYDKIKAGIAKLLGRDVRIGIPVDMGKDQIKLIDNRFVVRFKDHLKPKAIDALIEKAGGRILRGFIQAGNAYLIEFLKGNWKNHLDLMESWYKEDIVVYAEPDIVAEIVDDVFPADPPNDTLYGTQANLTLQNADQAWQFLNGIDPNITLGSTNVTVCSLDRGIDTDHPDIGGNLTDGNPQLSQCYDFSGMQPCTVPGYAPDSSHGMGVYGIIAASTDNNSGVAGIAPNTHQIGLERPLVSSANYGDVLLWAAGFTTGNTTAGWPVEPIANGADIISCSHGQNGLALSGIMDDTFEYLSTYGRGGLGTLVVYSAGNGSQSITGVRTFATHPRTLAISNSMQPNGLGVEVLRATSNFGPEIDICAQGDSAPSLNDVGGTQTFGGTSAAAPTVAAAAALMLSVEPQLTWINLRDILRNTAVVIDGANVDPVGQWVGGFSQWYGFGRLDILAAVQGANDFDTGAVNLVIRDNLSDDGSVVPTGGTFWRSPDIWIRNADPAVEGLADPAYGVNPPNQNAVSGTDNWVRVRVKNEGTTASSNFYVRLYLSHFAGSQFVYPDDFIPSGNPGDPIPNPLVQGTYLIGEEFVTTQASGDEIIYDFQWPATMVPPETVGGTSWHPCLLAEVSPHTGPTPSGNLVIDNSNLGQRNITIDYTDDSTDDVYEATGVVGNMTDKSAMKRLVLHKGKLPKKSIIWMRFLDKRVEKSVLELLRKNPSYKDYNMKLTAEQNTCKKANALVKSKNGRTYFYTRDSRLIVNVPMINGRLTPVVIGTEFSDKAGRDGKELVLIEENMSSLQLGGFALRIEKSRPKK
ncbi:S8 family peptidase [Kordia sp.]|uniref:S8 family peptidase n=1 Tax=Kordia sp. TaxID=1965332 RepID=UPI003D2B3E05